MSEYNPRPLTPAERLLAIPLLELETTAIATWCLPGLPHGTLDLPECNLVMTGTANAERYDLAMVKAAADFNRDVLLLRLLAGAYPAEADIVLRSPAEPMLLTQMRPCRINGTLWFVTKKCGRCVEVQEGGLGIHWRAPATASELFSGQEQANAEITHFLRGVTF